MRKIESDMIHAISQLFGKPNQFKRVGANTTVETNEYGAVSVELHGNEIARLWWSAQGECNVLEVFSNGRLWHSRTTFSRINALTCHLLGTSVLYSNKGEKWLSRKVGDRSWRIIDSYSWSINQWQAI